MRSGSVPLIKDAKDPPVKAEEGVESLQGPSVDRMSKLIKGAEVAYKQTRAKEDGSQWIQCTIIDISEVRNKKQWVVSLSDCVVADSIRQVPGARSRAR